MSADAKGFDLSLNNVNKNVFNGAKTDAREAEVSYHLKHAWMDFCNHTS